MSLGWAGVELKDRGLVKGQVGGQAPRVLPCPGQPHFLRPFCLGPLWPDLRPYSLSALMVLTPRSSNSIDVRWGLVIRILFLCVFFCLAAWPVGS